MKGRKLVIPIVLGIVLVSLVVTFFVADLGQKLLHFIELAALCVSVGALLFALQQFLDAGQELHSLQEVSRQLSTQFVDRFPQNLVALANFVGSSHGELDIVADFAGYGAYSNYEDFVSYESALKKRGQSSKIRLLLYDEDLVVTAVTQQWPDIEAVRKENDGKYLEVFYRNHKQLIELCCSRSFASFADFRDGITYPQFIKLQLEDEKRIRRELLEVANIEIKAIAGPTPGFMVHAWIVSDRALFSFDVTTAHLKELCFKTDDLRLKHIFTVIFDSLWNAPTVQSQAAASA